MTTNQIAKALLTMRETRMTGYIMAGQLREELGYDGYGEALRLRWIEPDMDQSGMVTITNHLAKVAEMRTLAAECKCNCKGDDHCAGCKDGGKCTCESVQAESIKESESSPGAHFFAQAHAFRRNRSMGENEPVTEVATLGLGRTGEAPNTPVVGLGAQANSPVSPPPNNVQPSAPPPPRPTQPVGAPAKNPLLTQFADAEQMAQQKYGKPFQQLPPQQQDEISRTVGRTAGAPV